MYAKLSVALVISTLILTPSWSQLVDIKFEDDTDETYVADDPLTDQEGWELPVVGSEDWVVEEYLDNTYGFIDHPTGGGDQMIVGRSIGGAGAARAQLNDVDFEEGGTYTCIFDVAVNFDGTLPATQNIGSFSTQEFTPGTEATFIAVFAWDNLDDADAWSINYIGFNSAGTQITFIPDAPKDTEDFHFAGLVPNRWYRCSTTFNLDTNQIVRAEVTDLDDDVSYSVEPTNWYLDGGDDGELPAPTGFRFFVGGVNEGNIVAADNTLIFSDCNADGIDDADQIGDDPDCNENGILDICDRDCDENGEVDECEVDVDPTLDCNANGIHDACDLIDIPDEVDCDGNDLIDVCEIDDDPDLDCNDNDVLDHCNDDLTPILFVRGDSTGDGLIDILDLFDSLEYQFIDGEPLCLEALDFVDDGLINLSDIFAHANFVFLDGADPPAPYPACGDDLDDDDLDCEAHCDCA